MDPFLDVIVGALVEQHGCHTVVLYGSRARGEENPQSDYDVLGFKDAGGKVSDCRCIDGRYLDAHLYPAGDVDGKAKDFRQLFKGRVLRERDGFGTRLLAQVDAVVAAGPEAVAADQLQLRRVWYEKTLKRIARGDAEGDLRRAMLLMNAIDDYFDFRRLWVWGPRLSFQWLRDNDAAAYAVFERALKPGADLAALTALARVVVGETASTGSA